MQYHTMTTLKNSSTGRFSFRGPTCYKRGQVGHKARVCTIQRLITTVRNSTAAHSIIAQTIKEHLRNLKILLQINCFCRYSVALYPRTRDQCQPISGIQFRISIDVLNLQCHRGYKHRLLLICSSYPLCRVMKWSSINLLMQIFSQQV